MAQIFEMLPTPKGIITHLNRCSLPPQTLVGLPFSLIHLPVHVNQATSNPNLPTTKDQLA